MIPEFSPRPGVDLCDQNLFKILRQSWFEELFRPRMDPSSINNCVLLLDLPPNALAGIDLLSFTTSPRFQGIKNLPPGLHFVFAATSATLSSRNGAWFYVTPGSGSPQVFVKKWDQTTEDLIAETAQAEVLRCKANLGSIWKDGLTPYRQTVREEDSGEDHANAFIANMRPESRPLEFDFCIVCVTGSGRDTWSRSK